VRLHCAQHVFDQASRRADVEHVDPAGVLLGAGTDKAALHGDKRARLIGANRVLGSLARIAVQAAGEIDRQSFR